MFRINKHNFYSTMRPLCLYDYRWTQLGTKIQGIDCTYTAQCTLYICNVRQSSSYLTLDIYTYSTIIIDMCGLWTHTGMSKDLPVDNI